MNSGWIKLHRRILDHPWLPQRTDWAWAWVTICMCADRKTGEVNLTEVYRELKQHFNFQDAREAASTSA